MKGRLTQFSSLPRGLWGIASRTINCTWIIKLLHPRPIIFSSSIISDIIYLQVKLFSISQNIDRTGRKLYIYLRKLRRFLFGEGYITPSPLIDVRETYYDNRIRCDTKISKILSIAQFRNYDELNILKG